MSYAEYERLLAALSDPDRDDGPDLPPEMRCDPGDVGVWAIWEGGPIKTAADASIAKVTRSWQRIRDAGGRPELGDGMLGRPVKPRSAEAARPVADRAGAL